MSAVADAREWLKTVDPSEPGQAGAWHLQQVLEELCPMGRKPSDMGLPWFLNNIDNLLAEVASAENDHRHHDAQISLQVAQVRATQAIAIALRR